MTLLIEPGQDRKVAAIRCSKVYGGFFSLEDIILTKEDIPNISDELSFDSIQASAEGEPPISACLFYNDNGFTKKKIRHNNTKSKISLAHAEVSVIVETLAELNRPYLNDASLFVTLEPCPMCMGAILKTKIKRLYYFADDVKEGSLSYYHFPIDGKIEVIKILDDRFENLLKDYFKNLREKKKEENV